MYLPPHPVRRGEVPIHAATQVKPLSVALRIKRFIPEWVGMEALEAVEGEEKID